MDNDFDLLDLGEEDDFVWSFESPEQLFIYLLELHDEFELIDITQMKQAFLNHELHLLYMECIKFENLYLKDD